MKFPVVIYLEYTINDLNDWVRTWSRPYQDNLFFTAPSLAVIGFLPQLLPALIGGVLGRWVISPWLRGIRAESMADRARRPPLVADPVREEIVRRLALLSDLTPDVPIRPVDREPVVPGRRS